MAAGREEGREQGEALGAATEGGNWIENIRGERKAMSDVSSGDETGS